MRIEESEEKEETLDDTTMRDGRLAWRIENTQTLKTASDRVSIVPRNSLKYPDAIRLILYYISLIVVPIQALINLLVLLFSPKSGRYASQIMRCVEIDQVVG